MELRKKGKSLLMLLLLLAGLVCITAGLGTIVRQWWNERSLALGTIPGDILVQVPSHELLDNDLYITESRRNYKGGMHLIIPVIGVDTAVGETTDPIGLRELPGLYELSQMPDEEGGNVSIAGHRDIYNMVFLDVGLLRPGDALYLIFDHQLYHYQVAGSRVVASNDWSVIQRQGFTALTLTTCDPIGTTRNRLVIVGELQGVEPYDEDIELPA